MGCLQSTPQLPINSTLKNETSTISSENHRVQNEIQNSKLKQSKPVAMPTDETQLDNRNVTISYPTSRAASSTSPSKNKTTSTLSVSPGGSKKTWKGVAGNGGNTKKLKNPDNPPLSARPRTDTWDILTSISAEAKLGLQDNEQPHLQVAAQENSKQVFPSLPVLSSPIGTTSVGSQAVLSPEVNDGIGTELNYTIKDQWNLLWETQSPHLIDPADVSAVVDNLLDKLVNRFSPVQVTFIQRKIRLAVYRLYTAKKNAPSINSSKLAKVFTGGGNSGNNNSLASAKVCIEKYHLLSEPIVRQILPKVIISSSSSANNEILAAVTMNIITIMYSLSYTSSQSFLIERTSFAAKAAAENAKLECDVNKKHTKTQAIPKPSQVPIIDGEVEFPQGVTFVALCAVLSIALSSSSTRRQKLQLFFYLCFQPEQLYDFLVTHPGGSVIPTWLLEVDNGVVLSLASLIHYHYFGHAFLPSHIPLNIHDEVKETASTVNHVDTHTSSNGERIPSKVYGTKKKFIPSQSRPSIAIEMERLQCIVRTILDTERRNVKSFLEKKVSNQKTENSLDSHQSSEIHTNPNPAPVAQSNGLFLRRLSRSDVDMKTQGNTSFSGPNVANGQTSKDTNNTGLNGSVHKNKGRKNSMNSIAAGLLNVSENNQEMSGRGRKSSMNAIAASLLNTNENNQDMIGDSSMDASQLTHITTVESNPVFDMTDVMQKLSDIGEGTGESDHGLYFFPSHDSSDAPQSLSQLDISRERFVSGTTSYLNGTLSTGSAYNTEVTLEDFEAWAELALDDLALNIVMHKFFGEGILPSPAFEHDIVLTKWLQWQQTIRGIINMTNASNRRSETDDLTSSTDRKDEGKNGNTAEHTAAEESKLLNKDENLSDSMQFLLRNSLKQMTDISKKNGVSGESGGLKNGTVNALSYNSVNAIHKKRTFVFGGNGNIDGGGGIGYGVLYCVSQSWWNSWTAYSGWTFLNDTDGRSKSKPRKTSAVELIGKNSNRYGTSRPWSISTEDLLEHEHDSIIRGSMGSYEVMRSGVVRGHDYVLVPPGVWDVLYEMYGGGPPLPRMVQSPERQISQMNGVELSNETLIEEDETLLKVFEMPETQTNSSSSDEIETDAASAVHVEEFTLDEVEIVPRFAVRQALKIPEGLSVVLHPWIMHVILCDPLQPYKRGDSGPLSIRVMAAPHQPLWRFYAEIICRFSFQSFKAYNASEGRGKARLWKKTDPANSKETVTRYGPWNLLCKNRHAILPLMSYTIGNGVEHFDSQADELISNWKDYADNATLETGGLSNHDQLMLEIAVQNKNGDLAWPREDAAKAGRVRRLAEEDQKFRRVLQGLDEDGNILLKPPNLLGMEVDAMDTTGRWYTVRIMGVDIVDDETDEDIEDDASGNGRLKAGEQQMSRKKVSVLFKEHGGGGQSEWIDVESDRLATAGRFASHADQDDSESALASENPSGTSNNQAHDNKSKTLPGNRKIGNNVEHLETTKLPILPSFGACGLTNLGNTCYMNSALQCISYLPVLRSYLISAQYKVTGDLNKDNPLGSGGKLLEETADLIRSMWSTLHGEKSPTRFRSVLGRANPQFSGADQQDAQEFLNYIIDSLHEDSNKCKKKPYVEPLEDEWVKQNRLARVGEEAWRRFLRRNRSFMADVAMGQALNTVTCPVCKYSSRNFDPFNLLSIPIPTVADVLFQCTVYRRATAKNCPWVLDKVRKGDKRATRFDASSPNNQSSGAPSVNFVAEQYVIALSRLADGGDLRLQIQNLSGIRANQLRLCRFEEIVVNKDAADGLVVKTQKKVYPLSDKDGPASQHAKKRGASEENNSRASITEIVAFEITLNPRTIEITKNTDNGDDDEEEDANNSEDWTPSPRLCAVIEKHLEVYGDDLECRMVDTDSLVIAKAVSRSLWPRSEDELKLGLRVDAMDHRGNWFPGSVIEIIEDNANGSDTAVASQELQSGTAVSTKRVRVHFDNFLPKWDEMYSIEHLKQGRVRPLYSHAVPKRKPTEFLVHHRHTDRKTGQLIVFGQSFYIQCQNEWSNARAGAHILTQVCRFMQYHPGLSRSSDTISADAPTSEPELKALKLYEKTHSAISDLIDLLVDCDREYIRLALGKSQHNKAEEKARPFRNPTFDGSALSSALVKKVAGLLQRLPFEVRICTVEGAHSDKPSASAEEVLFPFSLVRTIGNFMNIRHAVFLQWREPTIADKKQPAQVVSYRNFLVSPVMYVEPTIHLHEASASLLNENNDEDNKLTKKNAVRAGGSAGIDLSYCLKEFCKVQKLSISDNWKCPVCKENREGGQNMNLWRLPDVLTFHIKRFNMSARWHEKITTKVNFPLTGLEMKDFCHPESPVIIEGMADSSVYDLIGVMNHYGSMTGGHYVATCKATACSRHGREEVAYAFNGVGASTWVDAGLYEPAQNAASSNVGNDVNLSAPWVKFGANRTNKTQLEMATQTRIAAALSSKSAGDSSEPTWLQFDDEVVEPVPPASVVSEMAYVLFYRRRNISSSNIAKYSTLD